MHPEITSDFSSKSMVSAIQPFIARRIKPALSVSDKFKSFKFADVKEFIVRLRLKEEFILERYPGGGDFRNTSLVLLNLR